MKNYRIERIDKNNITLDQFNQVCAVEQSCGNDGYTTEQLKEMFITGNKNDNFVCFDENKIVGIATFNPKSQRRNGSLYLVNLSVMPEYRRQAIGQNLILAGCEYYLSKGETKVMSTSVDKDNLPAIKLYNKVGLEIKEPICELDEDDEQYILDAPLPKIQKTIRSLNKIL